MIDEIMSKFKTPESYIQHINRWNPEQGWDIWRNERRCFICGVISKKANSHTIPRSALRRIAVNNKVLSADRRLLSKSSETMFVSTAIKNANTFHIICESCEESQKYEDTLLIWNDPQQELTSNKELGKGFGEEMINKLFAKRQYDLEWRLAASLDFYNDFPSPSTRNAIERIKETLLHNRYQRDVLIKAPQNYWTMAVMQTDILPFASHSILTPALDFRNQYVNTKLEPVLSLAYPTADGSRSIIIMMSIKTEFMVNFFRGIGTLKTNQILSRFFYETFRQGPEGQAYSPLVNPALEDETLKRMWLGKTIQPSEEAEKRFIKKETKRIEKYWIPLLKSTASL